MPLRKYELYHGAVLLQIVRSNKTQLKLFGRNDEENEWGEYSVSDNESDYRVIIKSAGKSLENGKRDYRPTFCFKPEHIKRLQELVNSKEEVLVCLVCADEEICTLEEKDIDSLDLLNLGKDRAVNVTISWSKGTRLHVRCRRKSCHVPRNRLKDFPWE